ncbi:MAG: hypothetical protein Q9183_001912 [Haloplaca sp. 2 TL-2023]
MPPFSSLRFPGDGLDHRRPASTSVSHNIIDLTDDIDIHNAGSSSSATGASSHRTQRQAQERTEMDNESTRATIDSSSQSPEIEFLEARSVASHQPGQSEARRRSTSAFRQARRPRGPDLRPPVPQYVSTDPAFAIGSWPALVQDMRTQERPRHPAHQTARRFHHLLHSNANMTPANMYGGQGTPEIMLPGDLDFVATGFHMGDIAPARPPQPAPPTYDAPPPPREGFTRSPDEGDVLICPNCEQELSIGVDKVKTEVWVAKTCGHVYCGQCARNRSSNKRGKAAQSSPVRSTKPFTKCVVEGCSKSVTAHKSMFQMYF